MKCYYRKLCVCKCACLCIRAGKRSIFTTPNRIENVYYFPKLFLVERTNFICIFTDQKGKTLLSFFKKKFNSMHYSNSSYVKIIYMYAFQYVCVHLVHFENLYKNSFSNDEILFRFYNVLKLKNLRTPVVEICTYVRYEVGLCLRSSLTDASS